MEFVEQNSICGAGSSRFGSFPELFLCRVSVHGTQSEQTVYRDRRSERTHFITAQRNKTHIQSHCVLNTHTQPSKPANEDDKVIIKGKEENLYENQYVNSASVWFERTCT